MTDEIRKRHEVIKQSLEKAITAKEAAEVLNLSVRQVYRLRKEVSKDLGKEEGNIAKESIPDKAPSEDTTKKRKQETKVEKSQVPSSPVTFLERYGFSKPQDAFEALSKGEQEHAIRVSQYAEQLFLHACAMDIHVNHPKTQKKLNIDQKSVITNAALYHDIGKALVPERYQRDDPDFTEEEVVLYRKHVSDGEKLIEELFAGKNMNKDELETYTTAISAHHECWDGSGYPVGSKGLDIPIIGRIVSAADRLDNLASKTVLDSPFDAAVNKVIAMAGQELDPALVDTIKEAKPKLRRIFQKYIHQTLAIPETQHFVKRRVRRPMELRFRPVVHIKTGKPIAYDSVMMFKFSKNPDTAYDQVKHIVKRSGTIKDLIEYFIYEVCDTINRFAASSISREYILVHLPYEYLVRRGVVSGIMQIIEKTEAASDKIAFVVDKESILAGQKNILKNISDFKENGFILVADDCGDSVTPRELSDMGFSKAILEAMTLETMSNEKGETCFKDLRDAGITLFANNVEKVKTKNRLRRMGIESYMGLLAGEYQIVDAVVETELALRDSDRKGEGVRENR